MKDVRGGGVRDKPKERLFRRQPSPHALISLDASRLFERRLRSINVNPAGLKVTKPFVSLDLKHFSLIKPSKH